MEQPRQRELRRGRLSAPGGGSALRATVGRSPNVVAAVETEARRSPQVSSTSAVNELYSPNGWGDGRDSTDQPGRDDDVLLVTPPIRPVDPVDAGRDSPGFVASV